MFEGYEGDGDESGEIVHHPQYLSVLGTRR